jgi:hypothetical protein
MVSIEMFQGASGYCYAANPGNDAEKVVEYGALHCPSVN